MNRSRFLPALVTLIALAAGGCSRGNQNTAQKPSPQQAQAERKQEASDSELLAQIPPPAKSRYMAIHTRESWENPFLIVSQKTVSLRIMYPEPPHSNLVPGTLMQPRGARKRELELRLADLPEALASLPPDSWPYGRVVALEEDPNEVRSDRISIRRNVEATIEMLNNLGVVVYEWPGAR